MSKAPKLHIDNIANERENFLFNREVCIEQFNDLVRDYKANPNKHFQHALFSMVKVQDAFVAHIIKTEHRFADLKVEKETFKKFCKVMHGIFGQAEFEDMFVKWKERCEED